MTKKAFFRDYKPDEFFSFSDWMRTNLPDSDTGFLVFDIDAVIMDKERKMIMFVEEKRCNAEMSWVQKKFVTWMGQIMTQTFLGKSWTWKGYNFIQFAGRDAKTYDHCLLNGREVSLEELAEFLSFNE